MGILYSSGDLALDLAVLAGLLAGAEIGFRLGRRRAAVADDAMKSHVSELQATLLGMLALLLGFTFAMAVSRFDMRKGLVLAEANAIGTAHLRARLVPGPQQSELDELLREYVDARLAFYAAGIDRARLDAARAWTERLQERLWNAAISLSEKDPRSVPTGLFVQSLNEVIDLQAKRWQAMENHVPEAVLYLVFVVATAALVFVGYRRGLSERRHFVSTTVVSLLVALVLAVIIDLDRPRRGLIRVSQESMMNLKETLSRAKHGEVGRE